MHDLGVEKAVQSQDAGLRHRKVGIVDSIELERVSARWIPSKRLPFEVEKKARFEKKKQLLRSRMRDLFHRSFLQAENSQDIKIYFSRMDSICRVYRKAEVRWRSRIKSKVKILILTMAKLVG